MKRDSKKGLLRTCALMILPLSLGTTGAFAQPYESSVVKNPVPYPTSSPSSSGLVKSSTLPDDGDALKLRIRTQLRIFTNWLVANNAKGFIGEVGWPHEVAGQPLTDEAAWNSLADAWYNDADTANLWVTSWCTGQWIGPNTNLAIYSKVGGTSINTAENQSSVVEAHPTTANYQRGINVTGAENPKGYPNTGFCNVNLGRMGWEYTYPPLASLQYLSGRGIKLIRLPFRWERIQPLPNGALSSTELTALKGAVTNAKACGMKVVLDVHNYGFYNFKINNVVTSKQIGSTELPISAFQDLWTRLSTEFKTDPDVYYGLMNEPKGYSLAVGGLTGAKLWEKVSQDALNSIRANGDNKLIMVPTYFYSGAQSVYGQHPKAWIVDPANNFRYEAHHYWDTDNSGDYSKQIQDPAFPNDPTKKIWVPQTYQECLQAAINAGYNPNAPAIEIIQDNNTAVGTTGVTLGGTWTLKTTPTGFYGSNYISDNNTDKGNKRVLYQPALKQSGNYNVSLRWMAASNHATNVPVDIFTSTGVQTVTVNQTANGSGWISLGTFPLTWSNAYVNLRTTGTTNFVTADAVKFTPVP